MDLFYKSQGSGAPLVLIHGTGGSWEAWGSVMGRLAPHRQVFAIDLPGFGDSRPLATEQTPSIPALAVAVADWMRERGLDFPHVAGNSLDGAVALELGKTAPISSVTIMSPVGFSLLLQRQAKRAQRLLPSARFVPLPGCGHVPMTDDPERVATLLLDGSAISRRAPAPS